MFNSSLSVVHKSKYFKISLKETKTSLSPALLILLMSMSMEALLSMSITAMPSCSFISSSNTTLIWGWFDNLATLVFNFKYEHQGC